MGRRHRIFFGGCAVQWGPQRWITRMKTRTSFSIQNKRSTFNNSQHNDINLNGVYIYNQRSNSGQVKCSNKNQINYYLVCTPILLVTYLVGYWNMIYWETLYSKSTELSMFYRVNVNINVQAAPLVNKITRNGTTGK